MVGNGISVSTTVFIISTILYYYIWTNLEKYLNTTKFTSIFVDSEYSIYLINDAKSFPFIQVHLCTVHSFFGSLRANMSSIFQFTVLSFSNKMWSKKISYTFFLLLFILFHHWNIARLNFMILSSLRCERDCSYWVLFVNQIFSLLLFLSSLLLCMCIWLLQNQFDLLNFD